jgi:Flp pilus assembly pilin Flp
MTGIFQEESGQATAEYALVVVAAAAVAGALILWATNTGALAALFDAVLERVSRLV